MDKSVNLAENAVVLNVFFGGPGNSRKVDSEMVKVDADKDAIHVSKELLDSDEFKAIWRHRGYVKGFIKSRCLPSFFRSGFFLLPVNLVQEVDAKLQEMQTEDRDLIKKFIDVYPDRVKEAKDRLQKLYDPADYPSVDRVKAAFKFEVRYLAFSTPGKLASISQKLFKREQEKAERYWAEAAVEVQKALRTVMADLVTHMVEKLSGSNGDGKKKIFRDSMITKMEEFLELFGKRNITGDGETEALVKKAKAVMKGVDAEILRSDEDVRRRVARDFGAIKKTLDTMLQDKPVRKLVLE